MWSVSFCGRLADLVWCIDWILGACKKGKGERRKRCSRRPSLVTVELPFMGDHGGFSRPSCPLLNGLLPNKAAGVTRVLDADRWSMAEARTAELIQCIQPNQQSEECRNAVASYVQRLIMKCFSCQVAYVFWFPMACL